VLHVFRDVNLMQLNAAFLYEMSKLMKEEALERVSVIVLFTAGNKFRAQFSRRAFSVAGPIAWNALPDSVRDTALSTCSFRRHLKTLLFSFY